MTETKTVPQQIEEIRQSAAERMDGVKTETIGTASAGDVVRQGDLYLVCLPEPQHGRATRERQLAPGTTQGSRHVASGKCTVRLVDQQRVADQVNRIVKGANIPQQLVGPVIHCKESVTITHPEHAHKVLPADSVWAVVYQRAFAEEVRRVQD